MDGPQPEPANVVCIASYLKGEEFLRECKRQGARVSLVTRRRTEREQWPRESLDEIHHLPDEAGPELLIQQVANIGRPRKLHSVVALEEFDVITAALVREHLRVPGLDSSTARRFRDKLLMRELARRAGLRVPDFVPLFNYQEVGEFTERVPGPWVLKPRSDVSASGIRKLEEAEQVWRAIEVLDARPALRDRSTYYHLESFVAGDVFHVDSLTEHGRVTFEGVSRYGRPPLDVAQGGGVFISQTVEYDSPEYEELTRLNRELLGALGLESGAAHAEFIRGASDGEFYFLEVAARVGGAFIADTLEAATGVNLWREWARAEVALARGVERGPVERRREHGGIALSLARQQWPDTSAYTDPEIVQRVAKANHVGLIVRSPRRERVTELLEQYAQRFAQDFTAYVPPPDRRETLT
ncbi:MAG TPA: ATP-grasp domain-containing protein [Pyrinomonadaceae bacterium]|nr:ATP-grasp domain-containing protein [Pyrinomonadaceae bacterium]